MGHLRKGTGKTVSRKDAPVKQMQKRFNPDEIKATKISLGRLDKLGRLFFEI